MNHQPPLTPATEFDNLLLLDKIEQQHIKALPPEKQVQFRKLLSDKLAALTGEERDAFLEKIAAIADPDNVWEYNHSRITQYITQHIRQFSAMPTKATIAEVTGLSRQTVHKHVQGLANQPSNTLQNELYGVMKHALLNKILLCAMEGDMSAAKLYLQTMKEENTRTTKDITIHKQSNYLQINGTVLNQQTIQQLRPEQLQQIEKVIKRSLAKLKQG